jgi:hypothetical protein
MLKAHITGVCFNYFRCFRGMLQVLHTYVAKIDQDVAHVASVSDECCKCIVPNVSFFQTYVAHVLSGCCICFTHMLQVFHSDIAYVSHICCKCFI